MDLENLSIASISAWQQANIQTEVGVKVLKTANDQMKVAGEIIIAALQTTPHPEPGKGQRVDVLA
ncbi:MAG: putative motility protein [SAR324 cluster bacterium]|uniref:Putative motility protein n=1 Tax=SAR324 cluster bacterium TaxID=2024889 RepID=A0A7X9FRX4_9DELT|nr:putative motility protein [SAR324 cluster bacterium]